MKKITLLIASLFITVGAMAQVDYTPTNTGAKTRTNRMVGTITVGSDTYTMPTGTRNSYTDLTATKTFTVQAGATVNLAMTQSEGSWMNAFVYVDTDNNGFTAGVGTDGYTPTGDLVSFSFYSNSSTVDTSGKNSAGTTITGDYRSTLTLPSWTVPEDLTPGEYRIRFKYDWNNIDPAGGQGSYFGNTFTGHGGEIIDAKLVVEPAGQTVDITYKFTYNGVVKEDYTYVASATVGEEFPAITAEFPFGITATKPEGIVEASDEGQTYTIELEENLPFVVADSYENITHWYYLAIKPGEVDYLYHEASQTNIPLTVATKPAAEAKYAWAFVGDPFDGYRIYNYAAGADMVLSSSTTMAGTNGGGTHPVMTALPVADGNNELWIATASTYGTNGFFLAQKGFANNRMNNRDDKLAYWTGGADAGSTFYVERCIVPDGYYRIAYDNSGTEYYLQGVASSVKGCAFTTATGAESVWYYGGGKLLSYTAGKYFKEVGEERGLQGIGVDGGDVAISASSRDASKYNIACTSFLHFNTSGSNYYSDHCSGNNCAEHDMILENVMSLPVTISEAGFATLYAPVALTVPSEVKAYTVTINGEWATLNEITSGVIPANTGVVLAGEVVDNEVTPATADTYDFVVTTTDATVASDLRGSAPATYYTETGTYYALAQVDGVVGFYKDQFNNSRFQNNSHKAYLYVAEAAGIASYSFRFGEGTTGIDEITDNRVQSTVIYDLTGRRVEAITAPGIYIVGGKKVLVK